MTDKFGILSLRQLFQFVFSDKDNNSILGIPQELFYKPKDKKFYQTRYDKLLHIPLGVAAGPHSQMAQNIIGAWLCGARYIELKTIQTLDELEVSKPCIDAADEGYNCEWSQELKIAQSYDQYLNAWIIIHILAHQMGMNETGTIFNMSAGYNMEGILKENVQWFFDKMQNCSIEKKEKINSISDLFPAIHDIDIPDCISDNITLSTMHGCPPDEIENIGLYLIKEKRFHTTIKLNPTLLGKDDLRKILNEDAGFKTIVPDEAFEHDLKYPDAISLIKKLRNQASFSNVDFNIKLSNTLESLNIREVLPEKESMNYMSGRALHPISVKLAAKLQNDFKGELDISFSAGADCFNFPELIACNLKPVTVCTDLLKPGGYMRLKQYADELNKAFSTLNAQNIDEFILKSNSVNNSVELSALQNLNRYADKVADLKEYKKQGFKDLSIKTQRNLSYFDCIAAPCVETCPTNQNIPQYMYHTADEENEKAFNVILNTNPLPTVTGMICDHPCQLKCTRINYDESLKIREIKRFISENADFSDVEKKVSNENRVAVIGAGPSGLSCAYFLALAGFKVNIYEEKSSGGGMLRSVIPAFRLTDKAIDIDTERIQNLGIQIHYNNRVDKSFFDKLTKENEFIYVSTGAQLSKKIDFAPERAVNGLLDPLIFLHMAKTGQDTGIGKNVAIIGGGNTAMDTARTAWRLVGAEGSVSIIYRRTVSEMPADMGEIKAVMEEGITILELTAPESLLVEDENVTGLLCYKMQLSGKDNSGRLQPVKVSGSEFILHFDTIIPAIGQDLDIDFIDKSYLKATVNEYKTKIPGIYIGGDALRGASTAINAIGDGRKTAEIIINASKQSKQHNNDILKKDISYKDLILKKAKRIKSESLTEVAVNNRRNFNQISISLNSEQAVKEASRCLYCDEVCNICVTVCPNFANYAYHTDEVKINLPKAISGENGIKLEFDKIFEIKQSTQIINLTDFCNECGNCQTFCPTSGAPFKDKPHFFLTIKSFKEAEYGYFFNAMKDRTVLIFKDKQTVKTLTFIGGKFEYETDQMKAVINKDKFDIEKVFFTAACVKEAYFDFAAEMYVMFKGLSQLAVNN